MIFSGLYAMSMNCMEAAESQFNCALRTSKERELWTFANLNLAIVYLRQRRDQVSCDWWTVGHVTLIPVSDWSRTSWRCWTGSAPTSCPAPATA